MAAPLYDEGFYAARHANTVAAGLPLLAGRPPETVLGLLDRVHPLQFQGKHGEVNAARALLDSPVQCLKHHVRPRVRWLRGR